MSEHQFEFAGGAIDGVPKLTLERFLCDDLPEAEADEVRRAMERSAQVAAYIVQRRQQQERFRDAHSFAAVRQRMHAELNTSSKRRLPLGLGILTAAAAAAALFLFVQPVGRRSNESGLEKPGEDTPMGLGPAVAVRGGLKVSGFVQRGEKAFAHTPETALVGGDRLRVELEDPEGGLLVVLGLTRAGAVATYYTNLEVRPGTFALPDSLELDDAGEDEALYFVLSRARQDTAELARWLALAAAAGFPPHPQVLPGTRYTVMLLHRAGRGG